MTSELISSKEAGKERIRNALLGLLIALGAYALLFTINPNLLNTDISSLKGVTVQVDLQADIQQTFDPVTNKFPNGVLFGANWITLAGQTPSIQGVPWLTTNTNGADCVTVGQPNCTSTRGLGLSNLITIHNNCPTCQLVITGGTEWWLHGGATGSTSHRVGSSTVDLRTNSGLTNYIMGGTTAPVVMTRYVRDGISYLFEGDHWHVGS